MRLKDLEKNPVYRNEHEVHAKYCNGEGIIFEINTFTREVMEHECPFCKRVKDYRLGKRLERTFLDGQTTDKKPSEIHLGIDE
jgi:hypothetical protein